MINKKIAKKYNIFIFFSIKIQNIKQIKFVNIIFS